MRKFLSSFAENPGLESPGMNASVAAVTNGALKGFLLPPSLSELRRTGRRIPPTDEWRLRALARRASLLFVVILLCMYVSRSSTYAAEENKWARLVEESGKVLDEIQGMPDQRIPDKLMKSCAAIAVFPNTISAGIGIGGKYGQGIIMVRDEKSGRWSPPAAFTMAGGSLGFQLGGEATDFVLLIINRRSVDGLLQGRFKLGADAAVAAGPVGRDAEASTDIQLKGGVLSYSRSRGLFAGVRLEGAVITQHWDGNAELYGKKLSADSILIGNKARMPGSAGKILSVLKKYPYKK